MKLNIIKIGGNVIDSQPALNQFLTSFSKLSGPKILVHGGGKLATELSKKLGVETKMMEGRRVTDAETLKIATMVYAGLINKNIVSLLQAKHCDAIGLTGADANLLLANKRKIVDIDYGFVGDSTTSQLNKERLKLFLANGLTPVIAAITHDGIGQLLNTNADTIASVIAEGMSVDYEVILYYCFDKKGVLKNVDNEDSLIERITEEYYSELKDGGVISDGMIPKLDNAFKALHNGVKSVMIGNAAAIDEMLLLRSHAGTMITK